MSTATTTSHDTGQQVSPRGRQREIQQPVMQQERSAANRLRAPMAAVRSETSGYGRTVTLPFPEAGIRMLPQSSLSTFASTIQTYRDRLQEAARELSSQYDQIKSEAQRRLGTLFNASDYPSTVDGLFDMEWSVVPVEPPQYLVALSPEVFQAEQARVRERCESASNSPSWHRAADAQGLEPVPADGRPGLRANSGRCW
ncbi:MAG: hypothetical protein ACKOYJ_09610 [Planctomycetia bacterium]